MVRGGERGLSVLARIAGTGRRRSGRSSPGWHLCRPKATFDRLSPFGS